MTTLSEITELAKIDSLRAGATLAGLLQTWFPTLYIGELRVIPSAVSLNSVNGTLSLDGKPHYFKFHAEGGEETGLSEYYRSEYLRDQGWPMVQAVFHSCQPGRQIQIYPLIEFPTLYDVLLEQDLRYLRQGDYDAQIIQRVLEAERVDNQAKAERLVQSLRTVDKAAVSSGPLNQLFYRRLVSADSTPRLDQFYTGQIVTLPGGERIPFAEFAGLKWVIDDVAFDDTLASLITEAKFWLDPERLETYPVVAGHGDEHNGNKFLTPEGLLYFDAAFASPDQYALLSLIKTTFHDTLAHPLWLYEPERLNLALEHEIRGDVLEVRTNFDWEDLAPVRKDLLQLKLECLWAPLLTALAARGELEKVYLGFIRSALFACPLLVYNLLDRRKYDAEHSLFALAQCIRTGSTSELGEYNAVIAGLQQFILTR